MAAHEIKHCPRCNSTFECKVGDVVNCQCSQVQISDEARQFLSKTNYDCLCQNCLVQINNTVKAAKGKGLPAPEMLIENLHYYKDKGAFVFTELYHMLRGNCCGNGCRHCPYGFKKRA